MDTTKNLSELNELRQTTPLLKELFTKLSDGYLFFKGIENENKAELIYSDGSLIGIVKATMNIGDKYPAHRHQDSVEVLIVYEGKLIIKLIDREITLNPGDTFTIGKNTPHIAIAEELTSVIGITIPCDDSYKK